MARNTYYRSAHWRKLRAQALARDKGICTTPGCGNRATIVDHTHTRPNVDHPTPYDIIGFVRSLCVTCDNQVKELNGKRKGTGTPRAIGCDASGSPVDPTHPWHKG